VPKGHGRRPIELRESNNVTDHATLAVNDLPDTLAVKRCGVLVGDLLLWLCQPRPDHGDESQRRYDA
jgi:hypothetical protein